MRGVAPDRAPSRPRARAPARRSAAPTTTRGRRGCARPSTACRAASRSANIIGRGQHRHQRVEPRRRPDRVGDERRQDQERAVRDVDHAHDAEDQRQARRQQRVRPPISRPRTIDLDELGHSAPDGSPALRRPACQRHDLARVVVAPPRAARSRACRSATGRSRNSPVGLPSSFPAQRAEDRLDLVLAEPVGERELVVDRCPGLDRRPASPAPPRRRRPRPRAPARRRTSPGTPRRTRRCPGCRPPALWLTA